MRRRMMKSKIHRATVTDADLHYVGSITIDRDLMAAADLLEWEQVAVVDIDNGARFETYVIPGEAGSGTVCLNGAAARLVHPGDRVIVISYADYDDAELAGFEPRIVHVDGRNHQLAAPLGGAARAEAAPLGGAARAQASPLGGAARAQASPLGGAARAQVPPLGGAARAQASQPESQVR